MYRVAFILPRIRDLGPTWWSMRVTWPETQESNADWRCCTPGHTALCQRIIRLFTSGDTSQNPLGQGRNLSVSASGNLPKDLVWEVCRYYSRVGAGAPPDRTMSECHGGISPYVSPGLKVGFLMSAASINYKKFVRTADLFSLLQPGQRGIQPKRNAIINLLSKIDE